MAVIFGFRVCRVYPYMGAFQNRAPDYNKDFKFGGLYIGPLV